MSQDLSVIEKTYPSKDGINHTDTPLSDVEKNAVYEEHFAENREKLHNGNPEIKEFIEQKVKLSIERLCIFGTKNLNFLHSLADDTQVVVNLCRINDIKHINKYFEAINSKLPYGGLHIGCVETSGERKKRLLNKFPRIISIPYYTLDFILKRVFPKWSFTKKIYFLITKGRNRVLSTTETLGRLYCCGFEVIARKEIDNRLYFVAEKIKEPIFDMNPTYGPVVSLRRMGKGGKLIKVYKLRTMHPYAEYLQDYIYRNNSLKDGGKFNEDFRITSWGRFFRKTWMDELPMIFNLLKGDMKLVGVRPLSQHYFSLYPDDFKKLRINHKPGLLPPFYADMPVTLEEIIDSEKRYLEAYEKNPIKTDIKYFFKIFNNILIKRVRSS